MSKLTRVYPVHSGYVDKYTYGHAFAHVKCISGLYIAKALDALHCTAVHLLSFLPSNRNTRIAMSYLRRITIVAKFSKKSPAGMNTLIYRYE